MPSRQTQEPFAVVVWYVRAGGETTAAAIRDGDYTLRAVARSIYVLMRNANLTSRQRNEVCVTTLTRLAYVPIVVSIGDHQSTGALILDFEIRDTQPTV